jgi:hypothetical protein
MTYREQERDIRKRTVAGNRDRNKSGDNGINRELDMDKNRNKKRV